MESENLKKLLRLISTDSDTATADDVKREIAAEYNIPEQLADRIRGESVKDIRADAEILASIIGTKRDVAPLGNPEIGSGEETDDNNKAYKNLLSNVFGRYE